MSVIADRFYILKKGHKFNRLTVVSLHEEKSILPNGELKANGRRHYNCVCDCGNNIIVPAHKLIDGLLQSCGCYKNTKQNRIEYFDNNSKIKIFFFTNDKYAIIDAEDYDLIKTFCWFSASSRYTDYASAKCRNIHKDRYTTDHVKLHQIIMERYNKDKDMQIDHIDGNGLNNCKENLRLCTISQNCRNRKVRIENISGVPGVTWDKFKKNGVLELQLIRKKKGLVIL